LRKDEVFQMTELECLRRIATSAIKMNRYKKKYDLEMQQYHRSHPFVDSRYSKANLLKRSKLIGPIYEKYKEQKKQLEGYLFIYENKDFE